MAALALPLMSARSPRRPKCASDRHPFATREKAEEFSRRMRRNIGAPLAPYMCEECEHFHVKSTRAQFDETDKHILEKLSMGLRDAEIAGDLRTTADSVKFRILRMQQRIGATSRPNLVALVVYGRIIDFGRLMEGDLQ